MMADGCMPYGVRQLVSMTLFSVSCCWVPVGQAQADNANDQLQQLQQLQQVQQPAAPVAASPPPSPPFSSGGDPSAATNTPSSAASILNPSPAAMLPSANPLAGNPLPASNNIVPPGSDDQTLREAAFQGYARNTLPMTPDQIHRLKQLFAESQFAAAAMPSVPPRPVATSQIVSLAPGATPPVIRLAQGFVSSLVFVDSTGAPWPIDAFDVGNPGAFNIQWNKTDNTLMIQSSSLYTFGNLAVRLRGLNTPVMLTLIPGQGAVDYRVDLRVQGMGPNATAAPTSDGLPGVSNPELLSILDGVPPADSRLLKIKGGDAEAWMVGDKMYVRTPMTLISPGWLSMLSSADGMHAYQMQKAPMLLASQHGKLLQLNIEGL